MGATTDVDVAGWFTESVDSYTVSVRDESIVTASVSGSVVSLTGVAAGSTLVTVTATNTAGSAQQGFFVGVPVPPPPGIVVTLPSEWSMNAGDVEVVDLSPVFDGDVTSWEATSSDEAIVRVPLAGSVVSLTGVAGGSPSCPWPPRRPPTASPAKAVR